MKIAVTGATGFLGRYIVRQLVAGGHSCRCWFRANSDRGGFDDVAGSIEWLSGELGDVPSAAALVNWGLARMSKRQAGIIEEFYFNDCSTREIADHHGLSERAVEGRLRRARKNLEKYLRPYVSVLEPPIGGKNNAEQT